MALQDLEKDLNTARKISDLGAASAFSVEIGDVLRRKGEDLTKSLGKYQEAVEIARAGADAKGEVPYSYWPAHVL